MARVTSVAVRVERLRQWRPTAATLRRLVIASIVANVGIVVTGGAVRLTGSGLGCPTWPRCSGDSFVPTGALGIHEQIEFGNRMLTYVLGFIALATLVAAYKARPVRPRIRRLALVLFLGIPAQAVLGGITVLTDLNPWVVMGHFLLSMVLISLATVLLARLRESDGPTIPSVGALLRRLTLGIAALTGTVLYLGTVVTGSGPHAGDDDAPRTGLDTHLVSLLHADAVIALVAVTGLTLLVARRLQAPAPARRALAILLGTQLAQGLLGYVQYFTDLPEVLVALHMLGAALLVVATTRVPLATRTRLHEQEPAHIDESSIRLLA
ncbi:MAG: COX15/CtaA family protein [Sporichthyaceae bacterium]